VYGQTLTGPGSHEYGQAGRNQNPVRRITVNPSPETVISNTTGNPPSQITIRSSGETGTNIPLKLPFNLEPHLQPVKVISKSKSSTPAPPRRGQQVLQAATELGQKLTPAAQTRAEVQEKARTS
jgi:hypothetical protein